MSVETFEQLVIDLDRPLLVRIFRCPNYNGPVLLPPNMLLRGYLLKKSRTNSYFNPWAERLVEIRPDGFLVYKVTGFLGLVLFSFSFFLSLSLFLYIF